MTWSAVAVLLIPVIKPALLAGIVWLGKLASDALIHFIQQQKVTYAKTLATIAVSAVEDAYASLSGSGRLQLAIASVAKKVNLPAKDLEDIVRAAYQATIPPLDALKNAPALSSTASTK